MIVVAMAMVALGMVRREDSGRTIIRFETLPGQVVARVSSGVDRVLWTRFENVPAYVAATDVPFELDGIGPLKAHIVWGGNPRELARPSRPTMMWLCTATCRTALSIGRPVTKPQRAGATFRTRLRRDRGRDKP